MNYKRLGIARVAKYKLGLVSLTLTANVTFAAGVHYEAVDLGTLPGGQQSNVRSINAAREAVGFGDDGNNNYHALLYRQGEVVDLGILPGAVKSFAYSINDKHQIVGVSESSGGGNHAFLYSDGAMQDLGVPEGAVSSEAYAINEKGEIAGTATFGAENNRTYRGVTYSKGRWHLGEKDISYRALNDRGVVGGTWLSEGKYHYAFYQQGNAYYAGFTDGKISLYTVADINNRNQLTGTGYIVPEPPGKNGTLPAGLQYRAMVYDAPKRELRDLGALPARPGVLAEAEAYGINDHGVVVGSARNRLLKADGSSVPSRYKAVLFKAGKVYDLNRRLTNHIDAKLEYANDINEQGDIVADGRTQEGFTHAVMLLPVK